MWVTSAIETCWKSKVLEESSAGRSDEIFLFHMDSAILKNGLLLWGRRNWIEIAGSAHPEQSATSFETTVTDD